MKRYCKDCNTIYEDLRKKYGLITQCEDCGRAEEKRRKVVRHAGRREGGKHAVTRVFRGKHAEYVRRVCRRENAVGFTANIPISHQVALQKFEERKEK